MSPLAAWWRERPTRVRVALALLAAFAVVAALVAVAVLPGDDGNPGAQPGASSSAYSTATGTSGGSSGSRSAEPARASSSPGATPSSSARGTIDIGAGVRLSGGTLPSGVAARARDDDPDSGSEDEDFREPSPDTDLAVAGPAYELTPSGPLGGTVTVTVPTGAPPGAGDEAVLITSESAAGPWKVLPTTYDASARTASAEVDHFSWFVVEWVKKNEFIRQVGDILNGLASNIAGVTQGADCGGLGSQSAYQLAGTRGDALTICLGSASGKPVARVVNMRRYPLVVHPGSATTTYKAPAASWFSDLTLGGHSFSLASGGVADLTLAGATSVSTEVDGWANFAIDIQTAAEALTTIVSKGSRNPEVVEKATKWLNAAFMTSNCRDTLLNGVPDVGAAINKCMNDPKVIADLYGVGAAFLIAVALQAVGFVSWFVSQISGIGDIASGRDVFTTQLQLAGVVTTPDDVAWWRNQEIPTGWESGETVTLRDGEVVACSEPYCGYSIGSLTVQRAADAQGATATVVLVLHDGDGFPLAHTLMVMVAEPKGLVLQRASDTAVSLPENRALCDIRAVSQPNGDVEQTFSNCFNPLGAGSQMWYLVGTRLAPRSGYIDAPRLSLDGFSSVFDWHRLLGHSSSTISPPAHRHRAGSRVQSHCKPAARCRNSSGYLLRRPTRALPPWLLPSLEVFSQRGSLQSRSSRAVATRTWRSAR